MSESEDWLSVRILRQDRPSEAGYWQRFRIRHEPGLNLTGVLQRISANPEIVSGELVCIPPADTVNRSARRRNFRRRRANVRERTKLYRRLSEEYSA